MRNEALSPAVNVDEISLIIPNLAFPFDISAGVQGLRHQRHALGRLSITITLDGLEAVIKKRLANSNWIETPRLSFESGHLGVLLEYGPPGSRVPVTFRLLPVLRDQVVELLVDEPRCYGPLPVHLQLVAATCVKEMIGITPDGPLITPPNPVKFTLFALMPDRGWRIPDYRSVRLYQMKMLPDRMTLDFRHPDLFDPAITKPFEDAKELEIERLRKLEEVRLTRDGDSLLSKNDIPAARSTYAKLLDRDPDSPIFASRLAMVDVLDPDLRDTVRSLAHELTEKHGDRSDLASVLAQEAALSEHPDEEEQALKRLCENGNSFERLAAGLRRGKLLLSSNPAEAALALEAALAAKREDKTVLGALLDARAALGDNERVKGLIPRWIAAHKIASQRADAYIKAGTILLEVLNDPQGSTRHFERAALSDPDNIAAAWGLAKALSHLGDVQRAIAQFERLERKCRQVDDLKGVAEALGAIGEIWIDRNEPSIAIQRFREALEIAPGMVHLRLRLALALQQMARHPEAATELEKALTGQDPETRDPIWGQTALVLGKLYLDELDDPAAAEPWARAALEFPEWKTEARELMLSSLERQGRLDALSAELESELSLFPSAQSALRLAKARRDSGDAQGATTTLKNALKHFPDSAELLDALISIYRDTMQHAQLYEALNKRIDSVVSSRRRSTISLELGTLGVHMLDKPVESIPWLKKALPETALSHEARDLLNIAFDKILDKARELFDSGDRDGAHELFVLVRKECDGPKTYTAAMYEADIASERGDHEDALKAAVAACDGPPEFKARATIIAANSFLALGGPDEAVRHLELAAKTLNFPEASDLLLFASEICIEFLGDYKRASGFLEQVLEYDPNNEKADQQLIQIFEATDDQIGLAHYLEIGRETPNTVQRLRLAAKIYFAEGSMERAETIFKRLYEQTQGYRRRPSPGQDTQIERQTG